MSRLTRDETTEPISRDQILRHARGQGNIIFPVQLTTSRIGNLTRLIHTLLYVMTIHTYIHTVLYRDYKYFQYSGGFFDSKMCMLSPHLFWTSDLWTHHPGSHRRKVTQDFFTFLSREGLNRPLPLSTVKLNFVYPRINRSPLVGHEKFQFV